MEPEEEQSKNEEVAKQEDELKEEDLSKEEKQLHAGLFQIAFSERKRINLEKMKEHCGMRMGSYRERARILELLQANLGEKIDCTKAFLKEVIRFFEDQLSLYGFFFKSMGKINLKNTPPEVFVYDIMQKAVLELVDLNEAEVEQLKVLTSWTEKILIPAFKALYQMYKEDGKKRTSKLEDEKSAADNIRQKEVKAVYKMQDGNDLLETQLALLDKFKAADQAVANWGAQLYKNWQELLAKEGEVREEIQKKIIEFHDKFTRVYAESDATKALLKFWMQIENVPAIHKVLGSFLSEQDQAIINWNCRTDKFHLNIEGWLNLKQEAAKVGNPLRIVEILQSKKFKCKLQKSQREYLPVWIYFTIDRNMLINEEGTQKVLLKLTQSGLKVDRISENLIEIQGIEIGFLIDSKRKEAIHFSTMDEAEQFSFFLKNLLKQSQS